MINRIINPIPRARFSFGQHQETSSGQLRFLSMRRVLFFKFQPIRFDHKGSEVRESLTFSSDLARFRVLGADRKKSRLSRRDCRIMCQKCRGFKINERFDILVVTVSSVVFWVHVSCLMGYLLDGIPWYLERNGIEGQSKANICSTQKDHSSS